MLTCTFHELQVLYINYNNPHKLHLILQISEDHTCLDIANPHNFFFEIESLYWQHWEPNLTILEMLGNGIGMGNTATLEGSNTGRQRLPNTKNGAEILQKIFNLYLPNKNHCFSLLP